MSVSNVRLSPLDITAAGKNAIINGAFDVWQRGTTTSSGAYIADRWVFNIGGTTGASATQQTFALGTGPTPEAIYYIDVAGTLSDSVNGYLQLDSHLNEDARTFAGQTVTLSFWAKGSAAGTIYAQFVRSWDSGTEPLSFFPITITTSWARYSVTYTVPPVPLAQERTPSAQTLMRVIFSKLQGSTWYSQWGQANFTGTMSLYGVQLEKGPNATTFTRAGGDLLTETQLCYSNYMRIGGTATNVAISNWCVATSSTAAIAVIQLPVTMRIVPTATVTGSFTLTTGTFSSATLNTTMSTPNKLVFNLTGSGWTANSAFQWYTTNSSSYIELTADI